MTTFATTAAAHGYPGSFGDVGERESGRPAAGSRTRFAGRMAAFARRAQQRLEAHALENALKQLPRIDPRAHADVQRAAARARSHRA